MDENERSEEIGEVVPPAEDGSAEQRDSAPTPQSHEDNRRFQAARLGGERAGYERAMRELAGRESERRSREEEQMRFIAEDAREFARRYPEADLAGLDASESFRRFCGSRYGREPLSELYADYLEVAGGALRAAQARRESRAARSTGSVICPSKRRIILVEYCSASSGLCVTIIIRRSLAISFKISIICTLVSVSNAPVGSSASKISGSH